jgi:flagellar protein FlaG
MSTEGVGPILLQPLPIVRDTDVAQTQAQPEGEVRPEARPVEQKQEVVEEEAPNLTKENIEKIVELLNESARLFNISLQFRLEEDINRIVVTVFDKAEEKVIRQIPPEEVVNLAKRLYEMVGLIFNETA